MLLMRPIQEFVDTCLHAPNATFAHYTHCHLGIWPSGQNHSYTPCDPSQTSNPEGPFWVTLTHSSQDTFTHLIPLSWFDPWGLKTSFRSVSLQHVFLMAGETTLLLWAESGLNWKVKYNVCICLKFWAAKSIKSKFREFKPQHPIKSRMKTIHAIVYWTSFYGCFILHFASPKSKKFWSSLACPICVLSNLTLLTTAPLCAFLASYLVS